MSETLLLLFRQGCAPCGFSDLVILPLLEFGQSLNSAARPPNFSVHLGYNIIWISNIATSEEQVDLNVNLAQPNVGPNRPAFVFHDQNYWLQGINWGMNWDF